MLFKVKCLYLFASRKSQKRIATFNGVVEKREWTVLLQR